MHQPTVRVLEILETVIRDSTPKGLTDLSKLLHIPKSTLLPILQTLCQYRYLSQTRAGQYQTGYALFALGTTFAGRFPTLDYARDALVQLAKQTEETCYFGVLEEGFVLYLEKIDSVKPVRILIDTGRRLPAYATGIGKALLADKTKAELKEMYPNGLHALTKRTVTDFTLLAAQLEEARKVGYTYEAEESTEGIRCLAVPIRKRGIIVAAISVAVPAFRFEKQTELAVLPLLKSTAEAIGRSFEETDAHFGNIF